jgi:hypothetical protein
MQRLREHTRARSTVSAVPAAARVLAAAAWVVVALSLAAPALCQADAASVVVEPASPSFVFHHHVHKCGGFAFMSCVLNTLGLCGGRAAGQWNCSAYPKRHIPGDYAAIASGLVDFVSAEEAWDNDWTRGVPSVLGGGAPVVPAESTHVAARPRIATMFREPSARVVSNFLYNVVQNAHRLPPERRNASILDGVRSNQAMGANLMARKSLPKRLYNDLQNQQHQHQQQQRAALGEPIFPAESAEQVRAHLEREFEFVGIVEEFDLSVCLWLHTFAPHTLEAHCGRERRRPVCPLLNALTQETRDSPRVRGWAVAVWPGGAEWMDGWDGWVGNSSVKDAVERLAHSGQSDASWSGDLVCRAAATAAALPLPLHVLDWLRDGCLLVCGQPPRGCFQGVLCGSIDGCPTHRRLSLTVCWVCGCSNQCGNYLCWHCLDLDTHRSTSRLRLALSKCAVCAIWDVLWNVISMRSADARAGCHHGCRAASDPLREPNRQPPLPRGPACVLPASGGGVAGVARAARLGAGRGLGRRCGLVRTTTHILGK